MPASYEHQNFEAIGINDDQLVADVFNRLAQWSGAALDDGRPSEGRETQRDLSPVRGSHPITNKLYFEAVDPTYAETNIGGVQLLARTDAIKGGLAIPYLLEAPGVRLQRGQLPYMLDFQSFGIVRGNIHIGPDTGESTYDASCPLEELPMHDYSRLAAIGGQIFKGVNAVQDIRRGGRLTVAMLASIRAA
ncbi:MAG: hypothetical protein JWM81_985 [Candidatus Saccharibacteria bacterium]|nr:hypothetical protein [Candidatus Saccharibacteria bacterium]